MAKKESPSKQREPAESAQFDVAPAKSSGWTTFTNRTFDVIKLLIGICVLPLVYGATVSFLNEMGAIDLRAQKAFGWGIVAFLAVYLFIWEPMPVYLKGQKILEIVFAFVKPLVKVAPYVFPIYTVLVFVGFWVLSFFLQGWGTYCMFFLGFSIMLHLAFSAKSIRGKKGDLLKSNYLFGFSFVYLISVGLMASCFNAMFVRYSIIRFATASFHIAGGIFYAIFKQLFIV